LQRSSKTEKLSFAIHTCCAIDNFVHVDEEAVGGSGVGINERRLTRQQRTARVGDRMVIKITKNERNDKKNKSNRVQDNI